MELWIIATLAAFFVKGLCGFANTLVLTSVLGFGSDNVNISPVELALGYPTNIIMACRFRKSLKKEIILPLSLLMLAGCVPGIFLLKNVDARYIKLFFGGVIIFLGIEMFLRDKGIMLIKESKVFTLAVGLISGVLCGLFGVGALLAAHVGRVTKSTEEFKGNLSAVFLVENTFRIIVYSVTGIFTAESLKTALILVPFMLAALFAGIKSGNFLNEKTAKKVVIVFLIISGTALIVTNLA